jgi:hypothetical protein
MHTACVWSEKLPFAGYSVVKERSAVSYRPSAGSLNVASSEKIHPLIVARNRSRKLTAESSGGEYRARTGDLLVANQALSQLS